MLRAASAAAWMVALIVAGMSGPAARADMVECRRISRVKSAPDRDASTIRTFNPGERLELVSDQRSGGYLQVRLPGGQTGWVYSSRVQIIREEPGAGPDGADSDEGEGMLEVHVMNVGQADAILIRCPHGRHELLIDAADTRYTNSGRNFKAYMSRVQSTDNTIEVVVATHPHADHIGNMAWVLNTYRVGLYVDNGNVYDTTTWHRVEAAFARNGADYWSAQDELEPMIDFCPRVDVDARVLRPSGFGDSGHPNDDSVIVRVDHGGSSFLFVGDAEEFEERLLLADAQTRQLLDCDFLKVGHHGSRTSTGNDFLAAVTPKIAAISCGAKGVSTNASYKHPRFERVQALLGAIASPRTGPTSRLEAFDSDEHTWKQIVLDKALYVTTVDGDLIFESDGQTIRRRP